jgi:hypothetical protein
MYEGADRFAAARRAVQNKKTMKCGICNRELRDEESIRRGIGPECLKKNPFAAIRSGGGIKTLADVRATIERFIKRIEPAGAIEGGGFRYSVWGHESVPYATVEIRPQEKPRLRCRCQAFGRENACPHVLAATLYHAQRKQVFVNEQYIVRMAQKVFEGV